MTYSRAVVERAGELRRSGLSCREIARELDGPSKSAVARWTRAGAAGGTVGRAVAKMDLPKVVGDGPVYPDIDPDDKDALIERLVLENAVLRAVNDVLKAASLDGMSNREKTLVIDRLRPCGKWSLRELTSSLGISKSSYEYQRRAIARPDRLAPLRALVRRIFTEDGEGARGYRFVTARLRELDEPVRASEKVVLRIMREEGLVPRWMRRKRRPYSSYAGEPTPAPPNLVRRDFRSALPNFLWLTDITEFRLPGGEKVYLSPVIDCFGGMLVAWSIGLHPDKRLANSSLRLIQARFQTRQAIESQVVGDLRDTLDRNRTVRQRPRAIDTDNTRQQKRQIVVEHLVLETLGQQIAFGNLVLERRTKTSHKIIERNVLDQLTIEHQVVAQCLVNGFKEGRRRAQGALVGVAVHGSKRFLDRVDNHLHHIDGNGIEQAVNRAKVNVKGLAVDIGLARDGTHRNVCQRLFHEQALESGKDGIAAANDAAVKTRFAGCHGHVPSICEHSSTDER